jgi:hypothetical protein
MRMLAALLFVVAGLACGFTLGFGAFAFGVAALLAAYALLLGWTGATWAAIAVEMLLALGFLQLGYAVAIVVRLVLSRLNARWPALGRLHASLHLSRPEKTDHSTRRS